MAGPLYFKAESSAPPIAGTPRSPSKALGTHGFQVHGGFLQRGERSPDLTDSRRYKTYHEILVNTSIVAAGIRYFANLCAKPAWRVEPAEETGDDAQAEKAAELVELALKGLKTPWRRIVRRQSLFKFYGFAVQEWTSKRMDDGSLGLLDIESRPQFTIERWDVDPTGTVLGCWQRSPQDSQARYLPRWKLLYGVDDTLDDSPEGLGVVRHLVEPAKRLSRYLQLEGFGFETDLRGIPIARAPLQALLDAEKRGDITPAQRSQLEQPLRDFLRSHIKNPELGLLLDSITYQSQDEAGTPSSTRLWDAELLRGEGGPHDQVAAAIERCNRELARIIGVEHMLLGSDSKGSHALSSDKTQSFAILVEGTLAELVEQAENDVAKPLLRLNGIDEKFCPTLKTDSIQYRDIEQITGALVDMSKAGSPLTPTDPAIMEIRDLLGLSRPDPAELELDAQHRREEQQAQLAEMNGKAEGKDKTSAGEDEAAEDDGDTEE